MSQLPAYAQKRAAAVTLGMVGTAATVGNQLVPGSERALADGISEGEYANLHPAPGIEARELLLSSHACSCYSSFQTHGSMVILQGSAQAIPCHLEENAVSVLCCSISDFTACSCFHFQQPGYHRV